MFAGAVCHLTGDSPLFHYSETIILGFDYWVGDDAFYESPAANQAALALGNRRPVRQATADR